MLCEINKVTHSLTTLSKAHITLCVFFTTRWLFTLTQIKRKCNTNGFTYVTLTFFSLVC